MKVMITHDVFASQAYGGISRYFVEMIKRLPKPEVNVFLFAGFHINEYLKGLPSVKGFKVPTFKNNGFAQAMANSVLHILRMRINNVLQRLVINSNRDSIVHLSYYTNISLSDKLKTVVTVYDMIHELFPQCFPAHDQTSVWKHTCCERADRIIAISENTKKDLVNLLGIRPDKITVVYLGSSLSGLAPVNDTGRQNPPYLLYVGERRAYKNFEALVRVFARSDILERNFTLICFGGEPFSLDEKRLFCELGVEDRVGRARGDDYLLASYYKSARAFICPSLYEGFGIPPLEAMSLGCPVLCSDSSSIPEVVGDAGIYFDPKDLDNMQQVLETSLFDDGLLSEKAAAGSQRARMFSWDNTAAETLAVYRSLL